MDLIKLYLKDNPHVEEKNFDDIDDIRRLSVAPACPHWSPVISKDWFGKYNLPDAKEYTYKGLLDKTFTYFEREHGCPYYQQFKNYIYGDVLIFNSKKYDRKKTR